MEPCPAQVRRPERVRIPAAPLSPAPLPVPTSLADLADMEEFRVPVENMLHATVALSGARGALLCLLHPQTGTPELQIRVGNTGQPDTQQSVLECLCGDCTELCLQEASGFCRCTRLPSDRAGNEPVISFVSGLRFRAEPCGILALFCHPDQELPAPLAPLLIALGETLGLALENTRRAQENSLLVQKHLCASLMQERQLLANEVHDTLAQNLACMRMRATLLRDALQQDNRERAANYLEEVEVSLSVAHGRVRELITQFRTAMDPQGLLHALRTEIAGMDGLGGVELAFENRLPDLKLPAEQEMQILHIVREALANVVKHARARHGRVTLSRGEDHYEILVEDDGVGLSESSDEGDSDHGHYGLNIMRERAQNLGGDVRVEDRPGGGTRLWLQFPAGNRINEART